MKKTGKAVKDKKLLEDDALKLDIVNLTADCDLGKCGVLNTYWLRYDFFLRDYNTVGAMQIVVFGDDYICFKYSVQAPMTGENTSVEQPIRLDTTPCYFGGKRRWFLCPECGRRCRILYMTPISINFGCRKCRKLTYFSQQMGVSQLEYSMCQLEKLSNKLKSNAKPNADGWVTTKTKNKITKRKWFMDQN